MRTTTILNAQINFYIGMTFVLIFTVFITILTVRALRSANPILSRDASSTTTLQKLMTLPMGDNL